MGIRDTKTCSTVSIDQTRVVCVVRCHLLFPLTSDPRFLSDIAVNEFNKVVLFSNDRHTMTFPCEKHYCEGTSELIYLHLIVYV